VRIGGLESERCLSISRRSSSGAARPAWPQHGREHLVLERARIGERWRTQRWDSLVYQFPNWTLELPGYQYQGDDPDG
jgi:hypothetical protein